MVELSNKTELPDSWTVVAIGLIVYAMSSFIHEGLGHGGACLLTGGKPSLLSTVNFDCSSEGIWVAAGGTFANLIAGIVFGFAARMTTRSTHLRYFFWLIMTINLFAAGGYFLYSGIGNIGDWADVIAGLQPSWLWRVGLTLIGVISYSFFVWIALLELRPLLPPPGTERTKVAKKLTLLPYVFGGILSCVAGSFNPVGLILVAISAAAASFGGTSGLAWMWKMFRGNRIPAIQSQVSFRPLIRSRGWIIAALIVSAIFIGVLGPGIKFS